MRLALVLVVGLLGCSSDDEPSGQRGDDGGVTQVADAGGSGSSGSSGNSGTSGTVTPAVDASSQDSGGTGSSCDLSKASPLGTSASCSTSDGTCPESCGGGTWYGCQQDGYAPEGLSGCYTIVPKGQPNHMTCCPARQCTRYSASDGLCSGKKAFFCPAGTTRAGCVQVQSTTFTCCP